MSCDVACYYLLLSSARDNPLIHQGHSRRDCLGFTVARTTLFREQKEDSRRRRPARSQDGSLWLMVYRREERNLYAFLYRSIIF